MKVSEKAAFFFCYAARLLSIFIFKRHYKIFCVNGKYGIQV